MAAASLKTEMTPSSHVFPDRVGHEIISTAILPLPLIQEDQLSVNGERMCAKYWLPASGRLAQEQGG